MKLLKVFSSSLVPSCSSCLRGSLKKDVGELRGCDRFLEVGGVRSLLGSWKGCDRYLGSLRGAIAVWEVEGVRSLFGKLRGCDSVSADLSVRCLGG